MSILSIGLLDVGDMRCEYSWKMPRIEQFRLTMTYKALVHSLGA